LKKCIVLVVEETRGFRSGESGFRRQDVECDLHKDGALKLLFLFRESVRVAVPWEERKTSKFKDDKMPRGQRQRMLSKRQTARASAGKK